MKKIFLYFVVFILTAVGVQVNAQKFSDWSEPVNLGPAVNSPANESAAVLTNNGRTLFFTSNRSGTLGGEDIWVLTRRNRKADWGEAVNLGPMINSGTMDRLRSISPDGRILLFQSSRPGGEGGNDIWASVRQRTNDEFGWSTPINMGTVVNTASNEIAGNYLFDTFGRNHKFFFSSARPGGLGEGDIYFSDIDSDGKFTEAVNVIELNSVYADSCFWLRDDGLEIFFSSTRGGFNNEGPSSDIWTSTRKDIDSAWSAPEALKSGINSNVIEVNPQLSDDGETLIFTSGRPGGYGGQDIYISHRTRLNPVR